MPRYHDDRNRDEDRRKRSRSRSRNRDNRYEQQSSERKYHERDQGDSSLIGFY